MSGRPPERTRRTTDGLRLVREKLPRIHRCSPLEETDRQVGDLTVGKCRLVLKLRAIDQSMPDPGDIGVRSIRHVDVVPVPIVAVPNLR